MKNVSSNVSSLGRASRGEEERLPINSTNNSNQQKLTRKQKRAQVKNMKKNSGGKFKKY